MKKTGMKKKLTFREVQLGAYEILKKIDEICSDHNWKYFLTYGSLIGALRHDGIIPWDDDIDIMMPRPDYEAFRKYMIKNSKRLYPLKLFDTNTVEAYPHMISRVSDMRYHLIFDNEVDYGIGLFVDIYPLDGVGNDLDTANKLIRKTKSVASMCFLTSRKSFAMDNTESKKKMILKFPAYLWAKMMGNKHYINKLTRFSKMYRYENSNYVACLVWPAGKKYGRMRDVYKKELFQVTKHQFEDREFNIPVGYYEFLTTTYGDFMTPPKKAERKTHHTYTAYQLCDISGNKTIGMSAKAGSEEQK